MDKRFFKVNLKSIDTAGVFAGYGSVFGNLDCQGDIVDYGAFKRTIKHNKGVFPMLFNHSWDKEIALTDSIDEDDRGLMLAGHLYLSDDPKMDLPDARASYIKMKHRAAAGKPMGMSIGYEVVKDKLDKETRARHLTELKLWEISIVTFPANEEARVSSVKSMIEEELERVIDFCQTIELKEGRVLSSANRTLIQSARDALHALLESTARDDEAADTRTDSAEVELLQMGQELAKQLEQSRGLLELQKTISEIKRRTV